MNINIKKHKETKRKRKILKSKIDRKSSQNSLERIARKTDLPGVFHDFTYRDLIFHRLYYGEDYSGTKVQPEKAIIDFFDNGIIIPFNKGKGKFKSIFEESSGENKEHKETPF